MLYSEQKVIPTIYCDIYIFFIAIKIVLGINFYGTISIQINIKIFFKAITVISLLTTIYLTTYILLIFMIWKNHYRR